MVNNNDRKGQNMDTNVVNSLTSAAADVAGDLPTIIAAAIAIFILLWGVGLLKRGLKVGAR